jgi:N-acetylmuramoyl-L-alanine amidase
MQPSATLAADGGDPRLAIELRPVSWMASVTAPALEEPPPAVVRPPESRRDIVVVVDAGHGGHDPGAHGPSGVREKDVNLAISRRLVDLVNAEAGMRGVLTRSDDRFLGLRERMERARSANADLFVSIHADAAYNRSAQGSTVYVLSEKAASDEASRRLAARENAALIGGVELGDKDPVLASVLMDLSQNASISSSIAVGDAILERMDRLGSLHRRSVQLAPFMVLKSPDVPSVLVETAYISNPTDEQKLRSPSHQQALAGAVLAGIRNYFAANPPGNSVKRTPATLAAAVPRPASGQMGPRQHVVQSGDTLSGVASLYKVSLSGLRRTNRLRSDTVWVGQKLRIPRQSS